MRYVVTVRDTILLQTVTINMTAIVDISIFRSMIRTVVVDCLANVVSDRVSLSVFLWSFENVEHSS